MRKLLYIFLITLALPLVLQAQIRVCDKDVYYDRETADIVVKMRIEATNVDGTTAMDFVISDDKGNMQTLPAIIYATPGRYQHVVRSQKTQWVYRNKRGLIEVEYTTHIPHEEWMNHAALSANQLRYENCGYRLVDRFTIVHDIMVTPDPQVNIACEPLIWSPDPLLYTRMVEFMTPKVEGVKHRAAMAQLNIDYPVNMFRVIPTYGRNPMELPKVDTMINMLSKDEFITINSYHVTGYASPEGRYTSNEVLARNRSNGFRTYVMQRFDVGKRPITTESIAEDWKNLTIMVDASELTHKHEVLEIIATTPNPDARDAKLRAIDNGATYSDLLKNYYPILRRIELRADYTVSSFTDEQAKDLIYKRPELLSLDEIFRVALFYKPGSKEYRKVYEIAAMHYPEDAIANNNAAAAVLLEGDIEAAKRYLKNIENNPCSYINCGVIAYIEGDLKSAKEYFRIAAQAGYQNGTRNIDLLEKI